MKNFKDAESVSSRLRKRVDPDKLKETVNKLVKKIKTNNKDVYSIV